MTTKRALRTEILPRRGDGASTTKRRSSRNLLVCGLEPMTDLVHGRPGHSKRRELTDACLVLWHAVTSIVLQFIDRLKAMASLAICWRNLGPDLTAISPCIDVAKSDIFLYDTSRMAEEERASEFIRRLRSNCR